MNLAQLSTPWPAWFVEVMPWLTLTGWIVALGVLAGLWVLIARLRSLEAAAKRLETLEPIRQAIERLSDQRSDLDLRRVEHVLLELRDAGRRLEDALIAQRQSAPALEGPERPFGTQAGLGERVTNRLLALGYQRVRLVTPLEELEALTAEPDGGNGEVVVEARRNGALCKGRVLLRRGALTEVEIQPAYNIFP
jgi:hypothetical protein